MSKKKWITEEIIPQVNLETVYYTPRATSKTFYYTPSKNKVTNNVLDILPSIGNNSDSIEDAQKQYKNSKIIYNILENKFRENAKNNNVILPYKTGEHTSISNYEPSNFTILENSKIDENKNYKMLPTYSNLTSSKNNKNITKVNSMSSNPLDLDITSKLKSGVENKKRYDEYVSQDNVKQDLINLRDARNDIALNKYNLDLTRINNHDINTYDKTLGRFVGGGKSMLPNINTTYTREDGVEVALPTYNDLKEQKTVQSYETGVGKFLGDAASNIGRIAVSSAINSVIPYAGTVAYFGDMFADQYNNNLLNGYDETSSLLNASIGTATEAVTEKILGGIGGKLFGGSSEMSEGLAKGISKLIKNKRIVSIFSNGASEAIEEFVQTFTEKLNEQLTLEKKFNPKEIFSLDTLSEAIYSAGIGALTGGVLSGIGKIDPNISKIVDDNNTKNNTSKIDSMENTVSSNTKYTTESIRFNENDVNALESLTLNTKFFEDNNIPVKATLNDVYTTLLNNNTNKDLTDKLSHYNKEYAKTDFFDFVENVANGTIDYKTIENNVLSKKDSMKDISSEKEKLIGEIGTKSVDENGKEIYKISSKGLNLVESYLAYNGADNKIDEIKNIQDFMNGRNIEARFDATVFNNESLNAVWETKEGKTNVVFNPNASKEAIIEEIAIHEMLHDIINQETTISNNLFNDVLNYSKTIENYKSIRDDISESYSKYYDKDSKDFSHKIDEEVVAKTLEKQLGTQEYITRIVNNNASLAQKIYRWIIDKLQTFNESIGFKSEKIYWESVKNKFEKAYRSQDYSNAEKNDIRNKIVTKNNKTWVKADRQVISGTNPDLWTKQVENYINNNIRNNKDVIVYGIDGDELTITSDTAGKATFRNDVKMSDGSTRKMTDQEFLAKLKAEIHIDELAETSKRGKKNVPDYKNHSFAKDGFNYRTTYFEDNDGNYYKITMSVGINGNIKTIYNVGKMENYNSKKETGKFSGSKAKPVSFDDNIPQTYTKVNSNTLSNKYSIQEAKKNTQELKKSSFSLEQRVSGDDLLDAQDLIEEIKSVGANVDKNGYVTLYHQTTNENADKIKQTGKMIANEPYVYFSTSKDASQSDGRGNTKLEFKIPAEKLILDDIFSDNADVKIKLNDNKELDVSNYIKKEKSKDVLFAGDDINEFGYFPTKTRNSLTTKELKTNLNVKGTKTKFGELFNKNIVLPTFKENNSSNKKLGNNVLPTATDIKKINKNKIPSFKNSEYTPDDVNKNVDLKSNELKKKNLNKINNNKVSIDKLVDARNETLKNIDNQIKKKRELYNSKKNKNTKIANIIQQQIISMESSKKSITEAYKQRIERLEDRNRKLSNKDNITNLQRKNVSEQYRELAESIVIDNIDSWKDKKIGLAYKTEKMERNIYDIIPDKNVAKTVVDTYITPLKIAEVNQKNFINEYVDRIKKLGLTEEESVAVQLFGEAKFNISTMEADTERAQKILKRENAKTDVKENAQFYLDAVEYINTNKLDIDKIQNAVKEFRKIYNELFIKVNSVLKEQGYKEMDYKKDYFPHFTERKATSKFGMLMEKLGWKKINNDIPTDIAGITDTFKPGKIYFNHLQRRYGNITEYNALKGFDNYIGGASNLIYLTEPIQKLRAFENEIRYLHSEKGIQEKYNEIIQSDVDTDTKESQITQLFANASNPLNNFVTELRSYTDGIANKKSELDRRIEQAFNRGIYSTMSNIQSRVSANMVGLNISSALTNFIPITQAYSQVSTKNMLQAIKLSIKNSVSSDSFVENSEFLSNRLIKSEKLCQTKLEKFSDKANIMFDAIDSFTSNVVVRSKYLENIEKGMSPTAALKNADTFANNVMAGRDKASLPTIFNSKNPFIKLFSSFQLEVNNQYKYMLKDLPNDLKDEAVSKLIAAFAKMFFGAWFYNLFSEKITGRKSAFSPADIVLDGINTMSNENALFFENSMTVAKDVASELPFLGNILGGGRLPISSALPDVSNSVESVSTLLNKETKKSTKKTALNNLVKELSKPVFYIVPPFGGGQAKKTIEGLSMYTKDIPGSYTSSGRLRFTADEGFLPVVQAGIFGQYASKNAREYFDNSYSPLTEKQIEEFSSLGIEINEYRTYLKKYSELNKIKADVGPEGNTINGSAKAKKIYELLNNNEKYSENEVNYILSKLSTENETITLDDLMLIDNDLESYKYYFSLSSDGRDKYKALILNNGIDQKKYISSIQKIKNIKEKYANVKNPYTGTKKEKYKTYISNSKKNEIFNVINESNISKAEKIILFKEAGYSITNYKKYMFSYINSLNISKSKKEEIWKYLYEN